MWRNNSASFPFKRRKVIALVIGILYAYTDEFHQLFVFGRSGQICDVIIDSIGVFLGILIIKKFLEINLMTFNFEGYILYLLATIL